MKLSRVIKYLWKNFRWFAIPQMIFVTLEWPVIKREATRIVDEDELTDHLASLVYGDR